MTIPSQMGSQANSCSTSNPALYRASSFPALMDRSANLSTAELAFRIFAVFRGHPHICNMLTHISRSNWAQVERELNVILDPATTTSDVSPLARNIIDLMCAERGVTGKIVKPCFHAALHRFLGPGEAEQLIRRVEALSLELEWEDDHPAPTTSPLEVGHDRTSH